MKRSRAKSVGHLIRLARALGWACLLCSCGAAPPPTPVEPTHSAVEAPSTAGRGTSSWTSWSRHGGTWVPVASDEVAALLTRAGATWLGDRVVFVDLSNPNAPSDWAEHVRQAVMVRVSDVQACTFSRQTRLQGVSLGVSLTPGASPDSLRCVAEQTPDVIDATFLTMSEAGLAHLAGLSNLRELYLRTMYVGDALAHVAGLANLETLYLTATGSSDEHMRHLAGLLHLENLNLGATHVGNAGLEHLAGLANLRELNLQGTQVTDAGLAHLVGLANLRNLDLFNTQVGDAGLEHLAGLANLRELNLQGTQVTDAGLAHLTGLANLQELNLGATQVGDAGLAHLAGLANLRTLDLEATQVGDAGLAHLIGLANLRELYLDGTRVGDATKEALRHRGIKVR